MFEGPKPSLDIGTRISLLSFLVKVREIDFPTECPSWRLPLICVKFHLCLCLIKIQQWKTHPVFHLEEMTKNQLVYDGPQIYRRSPTMTTVSTNQAKGHRAINLLASLRSWTRMSNNLIATTDSAIDKVHWDFDRLNRNTSIPLHKIDPHYAWHGYMKAIPFKREGWSCGGHQLSPSLIWIVAAVFLW